jgi:hypothetical protein
MIKMRRYQDMSAISIKEYSKEKITGNKKNQLINRVMSNLRNQRSKNRIDYVFDAKQLSEIISRLRHKELLFVKEINDIYELKLATQDEINQEYVNWCKTHKKNPAYLKNFWLFEEEIRVIFLQKGGK